MSQLQKSKYNILCATSRRFYTKKKLTNQTFLQQNRFQKMMNTLNNSCSIRKMKKLQNIKTYGQNFQYTEPHQEKSFNEPQFIKKQLKAAILLLCKKADKKWKQLYQSYQQMKTCFNKQSLMNQQNKFYQLFCDILRKNVQNINNNTFNNLTNTNKSNHSNNNQTIYQKPFTSRNNYNNEFNKQNKQNKQNKISKLQLQNIKLSRENQILRKKYLQNQQQLKNSLLLDSKQKTQDLSQTTNCEFCIRVKKQLKQFKDIIANKENQIDKLKENINQTEMAINMLKQERTQNFNKISELKSHNQELVVEVNSLKLQFDNSKSNQVQWRSIIAFQNEEINSFETQLKYIKNQYKQLNRKYKLLVKRINKNTNPTPTPDIKNKIEVKTSQINAIYNQIFKQQADIFIKVRSIFNNKQSQNTIDKGVHFQGTLRKQNDQYRPYLKQKQTINNTNGLKRSNREYYSYYKPNFYNFIEEYFDVNGIDQYTLENFTFQLNYDFLTTIRAILDAKFNQFIYNDYQKVSSFPVFTYVWLSKYQIHRKRKCVVQLKNNLQKDVIPTFFIGLMSQRLNNNWQIITFRQFLMETLSIDELYFYLMARHYIFQGDLLQNQTKLFQQISYITVGEALNVLQKFIPDLQYRKKIQDYMKKFIIYIRKRALVDAHFILRILLEYYQSKKAQQFKNIYSLTELFGKDNNTILNFDKFFKIFEYNFTYLSLTQRMEIYKKCYSCSRGKITLQILLTVLNQDGYLCLDVKKIFLNEEIKFIQNQNAFQEDDNYLNFEPEFPQLYAFEMFFRKFMNSSFRNQSVLLGLQDLTNEFKNFKDFKQTNIFQRIKSILNFSVCCLEKLFYSKRISLQSFMPILGQITKSVTRINKISCQKKEILDIMKQFKKTYAGKRILKFYRKKKNQMQRNFVFNLKEQPQIQQGQKRKNIRLEFNHLISKIKSQKKLNLQS